MLTDREFAGYHGISGRSNRGPPTLSLKLGKIRTTYEAPHLSVNDKIFPSSVGARYGIQRHRSCHRSHVPG